MRRISVEIFLTHLSLGSDFTGQLNELQSPFLLLSRGMWVRTGRLLPGRYGITIQGNQLTWGFLVREHVVLT